MAWRTDRDRLRRSPVRRPQVFGSATTARCCSASSSAAAAGGRCSSGAPGAWYSRMGDGRGAALDDPRNTWARRRASPRHPDDARRRDHRQRQPVLRRRRKRRDPRAGPTTCASGTSVPVLQRSPRLLPGLSTSRSRCIFPGWQPARRRTPRTLFERHRAHGAARHKLAKAVGFTHWRPEHADNMGLLGLTIDYGPFGFLDAWPARLRLQPLRRRPSRYAFDRQPNIAWWRSVAFGQTLTPLVPVERLRALLDGFSEQYAQTCRAHALQLGLRRAARRGRATARRPAPG